MFFQRSLDGSVECLRENEDAEGIKASAQYLNGLIQQEIDSGIPADRIVLGGFSQGGAMSIYTGLMAKVKLAGIVSLSGWLVLSKTFRETLDAGPKMNENTPIFSKYSFVITYQLSALALIGQHYSGTRSIGPLGQPTVELAQLPDSQHHWSECHSQALPVSVLISVPAATHYPFPVLKHVPNERARGLGHSAALEELDDVERFLQNKLPPREAKAFEDGKAEL